MKVQLKNFLKRLFAITFLSLLAFSAISYAVDYAIFRYHMATSRQPFGQVTITTYDAVQQKSGKTQFIFNSPQVQTCAHALFPRDGYTPCWYLQRHTEQRTDI